MNTNTNDKKKKYIITILIAFIFALLSGIMLVEEFPQRLEFMAEDALYQNAGIIPDDIKIIAIDEETLYKLGPYSDWDRGCFADLISILNAEHTPAVIGIDVVFSGTNGSEADQRLAEVCSQYDNIVVASTVTFDSRLCQDDDGTYYTTQYISGEGKPYEELERAAEYGFTNAIFDADGVVRRMYTKLEYEYDGEKSVYDSFAYKIASKVSDIQEYPARVEIAFIGNPGEFETISMTDVLEGKVSEGYFDDCIVLIGAYEEGMMDAYRVPVDYSMEMYGVEMQGNYIYALLNDNIIYSANDIVQFIVIFVLVFGFVFFVLNSRIKNAFIGTLLAVPAYILGVYIVYFVSSYKMNLLAVVISILFSFLVSVLLHYVEMQRKRMYEMRDMLFSMAEAMAETIEGRTPYNANHTKNVAKRCLEMMEHINLKHKEKKTELYFTEDDKRQLYLAAMLHDVGKMDIPLEIMDKPTKLGSREKDVRARLEIVSLKLENDALKGIISSDEAEAKLAVIRQFTDSLDAFNCGRPLKEEEWQLVNEIARSVYENENGQQIPYLTEEEIDDLHIKSGTLSEKERTIMQSHVIYTDKILSHIKFGEHFNMVRQMASNHHELLNGKGYPEGIGEEQLDTMTRILTIMDIYDSLIADDRPYKKPKSVKVAFEILDEEAAAGKVDPELLQFAKELYLTEGK